jgi:nucleoside-diphosphate-sugar epimerase
MSKKVLVLGVNGFIGSGLTNAVLAQKDWEIFGMDIAQDKIKEFLPNNRFNFVEGDITINKEWIEYHIKKCDVVLPLVAIATPNTYVTDPLRVFELDFESNLEIVRKCVKYQKRIIFPSTSEVYGMCQDEAFDEEVSNLVMGPINKQRWIYSCSKQLLDRVIYAYGVHNNLQYTLFRPFNWVGPKLDSIFAPKEGSSRVVTQFIADILQHQEIKLVDGGVQRRSFTDIDDGIDALLKIIENVNNCASKEIFNLGNPDNDTSIKELAELLVNLIKNYPQYQNIASKVKFTDVSSTNHYGNFYQDIQRRVPSIIKAKTLLQWQPKISLENSLRKTLDYHLKENTAPLDC